MPKPMDTRSKQLLIFFAAIFVVGVAVVIFAVERTDNSTANSQSAVVDTNENTQNSINTNYTGQFVYSAHDDEGVLTFPYTGLQIDIPKDLLSLSTEEIEDLNDSSVDFLAHSCKTVLFDTDHDVGLWVSYGLQDGMCGTERMYSLLAEEPFQSDSNDFCATLNTLSDYEYAACQTFSGVRVGFEAYTYYQFIPDYGAWDDTGTIVREVYVRNAQDHTQAAIFGYVPLDDQTIQIMADEFASYIQKIQSGDFLIFNETTETVQQFESIVESARFN